LPDTLSDLRHLIVVPVVNESEKVLEGFLNSLLGQSFPTKQIVLAFTIEEKYAEEEQSRILKILGERVSQLSNLFFYVHPNNIPGEAKGDGGANRAWGAKNAVEDLKKLGENLRNYVFSNFDADHVLHKEYIARVSHLYLSTDNRDNHFYSSAVPLFDNNLWRVPLMMRIEANAVTLGVLADWAVSKGKLKKTFSAFSTSLITLIDADFFNVYLGADDTIFYWRAFFARKGNFDGVCHYVPYAADAVEGNDYYDSHRSLYKQLLRWGWGAVDFPLSIKGFLKDKEIDYVKKFHWTLRHIQDRVILVNIVFLTTFGFGIVTLVNPLVKQSSFAYSLPRIMSSILTITLVCLIPATYYRLKLNTPMPKDWPIWRKIIAFLEGPLIIINLLTFSVVPAIDAQTRMMFGRKLRNMHYTPKVR
jgi:cellulose synthase/poly-beta-1,6-N-acetylglucosamine synthase-like glycosyltransferase